MADTIEIEYLFDPLCGWCYGASPMIEELAARSDITLRLVATGLFADEGARPLDAGFAEFAWKHDQKIAALTGQSFSDAYRQQVLGAGKGMLDSGPSNLALTAVALEDPSREFEAMRAIQRSRYVDGGDITDLTALADVLEALGLSTSADRIRDPDDALLRATRDRIAAGRATAKDFNLRGVPALIAGTGEKRRLLNANALFSGKEALFASLKEA